MSEQPPIGSLGQRGQPSLFDDFDDRVQPWTHADETLSAEDEEKQQALLARLAKSDLARVEDKVAWILQRYPETRDNHILLALRYWYRFDADKIDAWEGGSLNILLELENVATILRMGRHIQNSMKLWSGTERFKDFRDKYQLEFSRYFAEQAEGDKEIRLYLDETGTDTKSGFLAVAGICVPEWKVYEKHHAALRLWREQLGFLGTLHAADIPNDNAPHLALLEQLDSAKGSLLFIGHAIETRIATDQTLETLFLQLTLDALRKLNENGCLRETKHLLVVKEKADGFDRVYLPALRNDLEQALAAEFLGRVWLKDVVALPKGREVMLEVADHIAFGLQRGRRAGSRHPKDVVAETAMNVTGLDDPRERGVVFKLWQ